jgi:hypothetical protein
MFVKKSMANSEIKVDSGIALTLAVAGNIAAIAGIIIKLQGAEYYYILNFAAVLFIFAGWVITFSDIVKNSILNRRFWLIYMIILPFLAPVFYLLQREKLIRLGEKLNS